MKIKILFLMALSSSLILANDKFDSAYSSIADKDCKLVETYEMNMGASVSCEKHADIGVEINDYDARMSITLYRDHKEYPLRFSSAVTPSFSALGNKIEWRHLKGKKKTPTAMIVRLNASEWDEKTGMANKNVSYLVVSKITDKEMCVVGKIKPKKNQNLLARNMADKAQSMPCILKQEVPKKNASTNYKSLLEESKSQKGYLYLKAMGPIEQSLRLLKKPKFPTWRVRLKLYPKFSENSPSMLSGYKVILERINLSSSLYKELVQEHGKENVDSSLNNHQPSEKYVLNYDIMQNNPAIFNEEDIGYETFRSKNVQVEEILNGEWGKSTSVMLEKAPWESKLSPFPAMLRALAEKTGWLQKNGLHKEWTAMETPEGMAKKPWVEVVLSNHVGNAGGYTATWHDLVSGDSIAQTLYSIYYENEGLNNEAQIQTAVLCSRGANQNIPTQMCK